MMSYPVDGGKILNIVAFDTVNEWTDEKWIVPGRYEELLERYHGWGKHAQGILKVSQDNHSAAVLPADKLSFSTPQTSFYGAYGRRPQLQPLLKAGLQ